MSLSTASVGSFDVPRRTWVRLPNCGASTLFLFEFSTPDWELWGKRNGGALLVRPVYQRSAGVEIIGDDRKIFVDRFVGARMTEISFPAALVSAGIVDRAIEIYQYPYRRYSGELPFSVAIERVL